MNLIDKVKGITIGIRYQRSFRIPDIAGEMVDDVLQNKKSPFGIELFDGIQETSTREKVLFKRSTNEYLRLNTDDLILGIRVTGNFDKKYDWLKKRVIPYFESELFYKFNIKNIQRLGIILHHELKEYKPLNDAISTLTTKKMVRDIEDINISFSRKIDAVEALIRKGVEDYRNTIYNLTEINNILNADLDYQYYFKPALEDLRDGKPEQILKDAKDYLTDNFYKWLTVYEGKEQ
jgi:hypothetical protein